MWATPSSTEKKYSFSASAVLRGVTHRIGQRLPSAADCERPRSRALSCSYSEMSEETVWPASVAASISVAKRVAAAISALHSRQQRPHLSGSSNNSASRPHTLHCEDKSSSQPLGPII